MQNAETVLSVIRERGNPGKPLEDIYRQLFNRDLYLSAYANLYDNKGALTPGTTEETVDGMSQAKIEALIDAVRHERFRWTPVRRTYIPKKNGKQRPLGLPTWSDKLLQEVMRQLLEAYYEPQFSDASHGFRPDRGCHTALSRIQFIAKGTKWFIEGDISQCFDKLDHSVLLSILKENIHDNRFLRLVEQLLTAGYLEDWKWNATYSGAPQGGVLSPLLSNIYLDRLDRFVETVLIPEYTRGESRQRSAAYRHLAYLGSQARKKGQRAQAKELRKRMRQLPSGDPDDPTYRRLWYVRYADDVRRR
jgi:group II intron reverse transcriptase/maturase